MSELNDSSELQKYSSAVLYVLSAVNPPPGYADIVMSNFLDAIQSSDVSAYAYSVYMRLTLRTVLASAPESTSDSTGVLLPEPHEYSEYRHDTHDGRAA